MKVRRSRRRCFTLIEILIVIGIISVLIAILLPVLWKVRRKAQVLACPIAYTAADHTVHLTDPTGGIDIEIPSPNSTFSLHQAEFPRWSPSGTQLSLAWIEREPNTRPKVTTIIVEPISGKTRSIANLTFDHSLTGWFDEEHIVDREDESAATSRWCKRNIHNGALTKLDVPWHGVISLRPVSQIAMSAPFIASDRISIYLVRKDLSRGRTLVFRGGAAMGHAALDPFGDWVAWSEPVFKPKFRWLIGLQRVGAPLESAPTYLGKEYEHSQFCDWTEDGKMLVSITENGKRTLAILDHRNGSFRKIPTAYEPSEFPYCAAWRKYGH